MANNTTAYVGTTDNMWRTMNSGTNWTAVPTSGTYANITRIEAFPDRGGLAWGGNTTSTYFYIMTTFMPVSSARTTELSAGIANTDIIDTVNVTTVTGPGSFELTYANVSVSTDGGSVGSWVPGVNKGGAQVTSTDNGVGVVRSGALFESDIGGSGHTVTIKVDFWAPPDLYFQTAHVSAMNMTVKYHHPAGQANSMT